MEVGEARRAHCSCRRSAASSASATSFACCVGSTAVGGKQRKWPRNEARGASGPSVCLGLRASDPGTGSPRDGHGRPPPPHHLRPHTSGAHVPTSVVGAASCRLPSAPPPPPEPRSEGDREGGRERAQGESPGESTARSRRDHGRIKSKKAQLKADRGEMWRDVARCGEMWRDVGRSVALSWASPALLASCTALSSASAASAALSFAASSRA